MSELPSATEPTTTVTITIDGIPVTYEHDGRRVRCYGYETLAMTGWTRERRRAFVQAVVDAADHLNEELT